MITLILYWLRNLVKLCTGWVLHLDRYDIITIISIITNYISLISSKLCDMPFAFRRNHPFCRWTHIAQLTEFTESAFASRVLWNLRSFNNGMWLVPNISIDPTWSHLHFLFANIRHLPPIWFRWNPQVEDRRDSWEPSRQKAFNAASNALTKTSIGFVQSVGFVGCCQDPKFTNTSHGHWVSSPAEAWPLRRCDKRLMCPRDVTIRFKSFENYFWQLAIRFYFAVSWNDIDIVVECWRYRWIQSRRLHLVIQALCRSLRYVVSFYFYFKTFLIGWQDSETYGASCRFLADVTKPMPQKHPEKAGFADWPNRGMSWHCLIVSHA
jgi:hypothetical protein